MRKKQIAKKVSEVKTRTWKAKVWQKMLEKKKILSFLVSIYFSKYSTRHFPEKSKTLMPLLFSQFISFKLKNLWNQRNARNFRFVLIKNWSRINLGVIFSQPRVKRSTQWLEFSTTEPPLLRNGFCSPLRKTRPLCFQKKFRPQLLRSNILSNSNSWKPERVPLQFFCKHFAMQSKQCNDETD